MSGQQRSWIPEPVTPETRRFDLCHRCGIQVKPSYGKPRQCRDCYDVEHGRTHHSALPDEKREQAAQLRAEGVSNKQIALRLGISHKTVLRWLGPLRESVSA